MFFIPVLNPFTGSILFKKNKIDIVDDEPGQTESAGGSDS